MSLHRKTINYAALAKRYMDIIFGVAVTVLTIVAIAVGYSIGTKTTNEPHPWSIESTDRDASSSANIIGDKAAATKKLNSENVIKSGDRIATGNSYCTATIGEDSSVLFTAAHCFEDGVPEVRNEDNEYIGRAITVDRDYDVAAVELLNGFHGDTEKTGRSIDLTHGSRVVAHGATTGEYSTGTVRKVPGEINEKYEVTAQVKGGDSGGPVYNEDGELVGIISQFINNKFKEDGATFVPVEQALLAAYAPH